MPDRWTRLCRRLVPDALRARMFDPTVHDLEHALMANSPQRAGLIARLRHACAVAAAALECRRLGHAAPFYVTATPASPAHQGDLMMLTLLRDLRQAGRRLRRQPLFAAVAVLILAIGIGANVATFSLVNSYLIAPLAVPAAGQLVRVYDRSPDRDYDVISFPNYADARDNATGLDLAAHVMTSVRADDDEEPAAVELVTGNYFRVLQLVPSAGRLLNTSDDGAEGAHPVVVLSDRLWRARYHASPSVIGRAIRLNDMPFAIVGVAPPGFSGTDGTDAAEMWAPVTMQQVLRPRGIPLTNRSWGWLRMVGRRNVDAPLPQVQARLDRAAVSINREFPPVKQTNAAAFIAAPATRLEESDRLALLPFAATTLAFTALLLLVTCANLAGVMQARVTTRRREMAIRQSLGAGRGRLVGEWLSECAWLAVAGGIGGLMVAQAAGLAIARLKPPPELVRGNLELTAGFDARVIVFAIAISFAAALFIGLLPALRAASAQPLSLLQEDAATTTGGPRRARVRRAAVLLQVAASVVLLLVSALLATSLRNLRAYDPGFRTDNLAMISIDMKRAVPTDEAPVVTKNLVARINQMPGVAHADLVTYAPLAPGQDSIGFHIPGYMPPDGKQTVGIDDTIVGSAYFDTLGLKFVRGRTWDPNGGGPPAVVINETMAKRFWRDRDPVGRAIDMPDGATVVHLVVAGVVRDSAYYEIGEKSIPYIYLPAELARPTSYTLIARTSGEPASLVSALRRVVKDFDPRITGSGAMTFEESRQIPLYPRQLLVSAASIFGAIALVLTGVGLYGVVSMSVGQRTREIGVRIALGATSSRVVGGILREAAWLVAAGACVGLAGGYQLAAFMRQWLFGVSPFDAATYASIVGVLALAAVIAAWAPARRASRVDPIKALRA